MRSNDGARGKLGGGGGGGGAGLTCERKPSDCRSGMSRMDLNSFPRLICCGWAGSRARLGKAHVMPRTKTSGQDAVVQEEGGRWKHRKERCKIPTFV